MIVGPLGLGDDFQSGERLPFLSQMLTTSLAVQPHSPIRTISIGVLAVFTSPVSITSAWPDVASPREPVFVGPDGFGFNHKWHSFPA